MRILMVSMFANHFFNWTNQLKNEGHEIFWIDIFDSNTYVQKIDFVHQIIGWRNKVDYPGRYWIKKNTPRTYNLINRINQRNFAGFFEKELCRIQPDIVQSFVLHTAAYPLLGVMKKFPKVKWVYSAWGNDLFFRQQNKIDQNIIKKTLPEFDFMFADCTRDYEIANKLGFRGRYLGTFPTGGGYDFKIYDPLILPFKQKKIILIKGYQGKLGRCNVVLKAISNLKEKLTPFQIIVFGANEQVEIFATKIGLTKWGNFEIKYQIPHKEVLKLMGASILYIGNNISDGMPNTLLESIIMETFPIQSNPGGATEEIIFNYKNGLLIKNPESDEEIKELILIAINDSKKIKLGIEYNSKFIKPNLERSFVKKQVLEKYVIISKSLTK